jgi:hypothetical protein
MEEFVKLLEKNWQVVTQAPFAFMLLAASMFVLAYLAARWRYTSIIDQTKASNEALKERLHLKTDQAESYKDRAIQYDQKVFEIVESDSTALRDKALRLVGQIRDFIDRYRRQDDAVQQNAWVEMIQPKNEEEKQRLWYKLTNAISCVSSDRNSEYERRFKVDALMLRDELRSRLKDYKPDNHVDHMYEHPINYFGFSDVANDIEKMAKLLLSANNSINRTS